MQCFLFKTEPGDYGFADLVRDRRTVWEGVSNPLALKHLRSVKQGDTVLIYHTGAEKSVVGVARAASSPIPVPSSAIPSEVVVDLTPVRAFPRPVPLSTFRTDAVLRDTELVRAVTALGHAAQRGTARSRREARRRLIAP